jgi:hypothetical protein
MSTIIKSRKIYEVPSGDPSAGSRITILENNEYKVAYFASVSSSTGTITIPTGATILLDQFAGGVDAYVSTISSGQITGQNPVTAGGITVDVTSFDALGNYTLSGIPSAYPVGIIYILKIKAINWSNLTIDNIIEYEKSAENLTGPITSIGPATTITDNAVTYTKGYNGSQFSIVNSFRSIYNY